jgi:DNA-binding response OmpR family regulator
LQGDDLTAVPNSFPFGPKVLLVEDDSALLEMLRRRLDRGGFTVITAADGREALARFRETTFQAVVTDILMPEIDGFKLIRRLRKEAPNLVIVAISGIHDPPVFHKLVRHCGANASMSKPVAHRELVALLNSLTQSPALPKSEQVAERTGFTRSPD